MNEIEKLEQQKADIEKQIKDLKSKATEFLKGKWYKSDEGDNFYICCTTPGNVNNATGFGVWGNNWSNRYSFSPCNGKFRLATDKEILEMLINEAKRRKLVQGVLFKDPNGNSSHHPFQKVELIDAYFDKVYNQLVNGERGTGVLFNDGKWAELAHQIKIGEYETKWVDGVLHVGCQRIPQYLVEKCFQNMTDLKATEIIIQGEKVSLETIEKILKLK